MIFDATSLYPSALYDEFSIKSKIESVCAFKSDMNDEIKDGFNQQPFDKSTIQKIKNYNPQVLVLQHIHSKKK